MKCSVCKQREAILTVPERIYWNARGEPIAKTGALHLCRNCFWKWAKDEVGGEAVATAIKVIPA